MLIFHFVESVLHLLFMEPAFEILLTIKKIPSGDSAASVTVRSASDPHSGSVIHRAQTEFPL